MLVFITKQKDSSKMIIDACAVNQITPNRLEIVRQNEDAYEYMIVKVASPDGNDETYIDKIFNDLYENNKAKFNVK